MKNIVSTGLLAASLTLAGCSNTEFCGTTADQDPAGLQQFALMRQLTSKNVEKICLSRDGLKEGIFNAITDDGEIIPFSVSPDNKIQFTDYKNGTVTIVTPNKDGTFTLANTPLIVRK